MKKWKFRGPEYWQIEYMGFENKRIVSYEKGMIKIGSGIQIGELYDRGKE